MEIDDAPALPKLVDLAEASKQLCVGRTAIYDLIDAGEITRVKIGKKVCFLQAELSDFVHRKFEEARQRGPFSA